LSAIPFAYLFLKRTLERKFQTGVVESLADNKAPAQTTTSIMQAPSDNLAPPKDDPFTVEQLKQYDGSDPSKPIYVAIKGTIFDVTKKVEVYGKGKSYNLFAGKDASRALGKSSLEAEDAVSDYSVLPPNELKVLDDWEAFFAKRYNIVGKVIDLPPLSANL